MADIPVGFNSDELVPDEDDPTISFFDAGRRTTAEMVEFAMRDRIASRKRINNLYDITGCPQAYPERQRWYNYFRTFVEDVMGFSMDQTPDGPLVLRFLSHIIERLKTNIIGKSAYSKDTLKIGMKRLIGRLVFIYPDFALTPHDTKRMDALYASMVKEGKLTVGKWRKSQWIGFLTLRLLLTSYISNGLTDGVLSWDVRISRWLSVVLQSSSDSRAGEIVRSRGYTGMEYLKWEDIELVLVGGDTFEHLVARVTLWWEKGSKDDPSKYRVVHWRPLQESRSLVVDPIAILLIHAIRHGQVPCKTTTEVLERCKQDPSKTLIWTNPSIPVIPAIDANRITLDFSHPATPVQVQRSLIDAARAGGLIHQPWTHDLRRGSAKDLKRVANLATGADKRVASALGHSTAAYSRGTTDMYAERESHFLPNVKEDQAILRGGEPDAFGPGFARQPYQHHKLKTYEINEYIKQNPRLTRYQATRRINADLKRKWKEDVTDRGTRRGVHPSFLSERSLNSINVITNAVKQADPDEKPAISHPGIPIDPYLQSLDFATDDPNDLSELTEEDVAMSTALLEILVPQDVENDYFADSDGRDVDEAEENMILSALIPGDQQGLDPALELPVHQFIDYFGRINQVRRVQRKTTPDELVKLGYPTGNSRDRPETFMQPCKHRDLGCTYSLHCPRMVRVHEQTSCKYRADASQADIAARQGVTRDFKCTTCAESFTTPELLSCHERTSHQNEDWQPKSCDKGCMSGHIFTTYKRYYGHITQTHPAKPKTVWVPQPCALQDICKRDSVFSSATLYNIHLRKVHYLSAERRRQYVPDHRLSGREKFKPQPCPVGNCMQSETVFTSPSLVVRHLTARLHHGLSTKEARRLAGYNDVPDDDDDDDDSKDQDSAPPMTLPGQSTGAYGTFPCPLGNCSHANKPLTAKCILKRHLTSQQHKCSNGEANKLTGTREMQALGTLLCPLGDCRQAEWLYSSKARLKRHLISGEHKCSNEEANRLSGITNRKS